MASAHSTTFPQAFGRYILTQKIAMGGMAEIFRAKSLGAEGFEKVVVIKRILPHFSEDEGFVTMFKDEAKMAGHLSHANVVQIFDFDEAEGLFYIAMEYVEGRDLKRVLDQGAKHGQPLSIAQSALIIQEAAQGLHYAHTRVVDGEPLHIVHRDVSPHNVMVSFHGEVKIMDFGIAKAASRSTNTRVGTVKGKCAYMSPEQARGKPLDARSDLFALGVCLWEMLTGRRLFVGDSDFETLNNVLKAEIPAPSDINPEVPKELDAIVMKALARDRDERQADCNALAGELRRWYYTTVEDPDAASLKTYMHTLFAQEIEQLRSEVAAEAILVEQARKGNPGSNSKQQKVPTGSSPVAAAPPQDRTVALDAAQAAELMPVARADQTMALPDAAGYLLPSASPDRFAPAGPASKSRTGWYVGVGIGAAALAALAVVAFTSARKSAPPPPAAAPALAEPTKPRKVALHIRAPGAQQILVDDNPICTEPNCEYTAEEGKTIKILARAGERMKIVYHKADVDGTTVDVRIPEPATPTSLVATAPVVIVHVEPAAAAAMLTVNGKLLELKSGNAKVPDVKLGDTLQIAVKADGYKPESTSVVVQNPQLETFVVALVKDKEKRESAVRAPVAAPGKIVVNAKPWAKVTLKGKELGLTPVKVDLPPGRYVLQLTKGEKSKTVPISVQSGATSNLMVDMTAE